MNARRPRRDNPRANRNLATAERRREGPVGPVLESPPTISPAQLQARVLYRDRDLMIVDKPAGLPVHAGPRTQQDLERLLPALAFGLPQPPGLVHRLDADTSGCLVLGRHRKALARLGRLVAAGRIEKIYWAIVVGSPPESEGRIDLPIRKRVRRAGWHMVPDEAGQAAVTDYRVLGRGKGLAWLELRPRTGRTHQLRVHCAALGFPVLGDPFYGSDPNAAGAMHLHARSVTVPYSSERPAITVTATPPPHMLDALRTCGFDPASDLQRAANAVAEGQQP